METREKISQTGKIRSDQSLFSGRYFELKIKPKNSLPADKLPQFMFDWDSSLYRTNTVQNLPPELFM